MANESGGTRQSRTPATVESLEEQIDTLKKDLAAISSTVTDTVKSSVRDYKRQGREHADQAVESAREYGEALEGQISKNPFSAVLVALGLGFLVGLMTRR